MHVKCQVCYKHEVNVLPCGCRGRALPAAGLVMLHMPEPVNTEGGGIEQGRGVCVCVGGGGCRPVRQGKVRGGEQQWLQLSS
jgi:hypothetical protein